MDYLQIQCMGAQVNFFLILYFLVSHNPLTFRKNFFLILNIVESSFLDLDYPGLSIRIINPGYTKISISLDNPNPRKEVFAVLETRKFFFSEIQWIMTHQEI